ncbi:MULTISPECIES: hypothetical protein [Sulfurimonas]|uniref:PilN domain-containing protein n=1 Tax=Sulfurimonas diazotrophicus TaxID=3131939 RepID=A0ABZ3HDB5_9BACT
MDYSFIDQAVKSPFTAAVRRVWVGGAILVALLLAASASLHLMNGELRTAAQKEQHAQGTILLQTAQLQAQQAQFTKKKVVWQQIVAMDKLLADQLYDLLDRIPDDAVLSRFAYDEKQILFEGTCRRFDALKADLERGLSGRYVLASASERSGRFTLRFNVTGGLQ